MVTEVTSQSWGGRLMESLKNIVFGVVVFGLALWLLWWNEGNAVNEYRLLNEVKDSVETVSADSISPDYEGKVVHVTGEVLTQDILKDPLFEISVNSIRLQRSVKMFQWKESTDMKTRKNVGGGSESITEYSYQQVWSDKLIDSSKFKESDGHQNPSVMQPENWSDVAENLTMGSFSLSPEVIRNINFYEPYTFHQATLPENARLEDSVIKIGSNGSIPDIGDKQIRFRIVPQETLSVIAAQMGSELKPWLTPKGIKYFDVRSGNHSAEEMLEQAEAEVRFFTWFVRGGGWLLLTFGMVTVLKPLVVIGDVIPFIGNIIGGGILIFSLIICAVIALTTIAIAWIVTRPLVGLPLLAAAVGLLLFQWSRARANRSSRSSSVDV